MPKKTPMEKTIATLRRLYNPEGRERVGFLMTNGDIVEGKNISNSPEKSFMLPAELILECVENAAASWHTHPNGLSEASKADKVAFANYPEIEHYIIGHNDIKCYQVVNGDVREKR